jgi:hypothetical protein
MEGFALEAPSESLREQKGMVNHERVVDGKDEWLTPPEIVKALGEFDLDPCAPIRRPWPTAKNHFTTETDGLKQKWFGRVWLNPPYGNETESWMGRMAEHRNGIALIFARTETATWTYHIWPVASGVFFFRGRLAFCHVDGHRSRQSAGAPSALIAYETHNVDAIRQSKLDGKLVLLA